VGLLADLELTQTEADALIELEKRRVDDMEWKYPGLGGGVSIPLISVDRREQFVLDLRRGRIDLAKGSYQNRGRRVIPLVRLCFGGAPHDNPDGSEVDSPHLHIFREGYGDKWAFPIPGERFSNLGDRWQTFQDFLRFCNVVYPPNIRRGLAV
jgi:hypothetical protein